MKDRIGFGVIRQSSSAIRKHCSGVGHATSVSLWEDNPHGTNVPELSGLLVDDEIMLGGKQQRKIVGTILLCRAGLALSWRDRSIIVGLNCSQTFEKCLEGRNQAKWGSMPMVSVCNVGKASQ